MSNSYAVGASDERPWGRWTVLDVGEGFAVKRIEVHGILVQGEAVVRVGEEDMRLTAPARVHIPVGALHQIANPGEETLVFIEVQTGPVLDEADIERISDDYGRV